MPAGDPCNREIAGCVVRQGTQHPQLLLSHRPRNRSPYETISGAGDIVSGAAAICQVCTACFPSLVPVDVHVCVCRWIVSSSDEQWVQDAIIDAVTDLPLLQTLQLSITYHSFSSLQLNRLSGLKRLAISVASYTRSGEPGVLSSVADAIGQSPGLTHLELHPGSFGISEMAPSLHELVAKVPRSTPLQLTHLLLERVPFRLDASTIPHLRSLTFLDLSHFSSARRYWQPSAESQNRCAKHNSTLTDIFVALARERIHLRGLIVHDQCNTGIVEYIGSYSDTLEHLEISHFSPHNHAESHALAEMFYTSALPKHASVMQRLRIVHDCTHEWNRNSENVLAISQCKELSSLEVKLHLIGRHIEDEDRKLDDVVC